MRISDWSSDVCSSDLSPVGMSGLLSPREAETASARAAKACGIPFGLSMLSLAPMEEISRESGSPFWFHVQPMKDRGLLRSLLDRRSEERRVGQEFVSQGRSRWQQNH